MTDALDPTQLARLGRGELIVRTEDVPGAKTPRLVLHAVVDAAPEKVWDVISKAERYPGFMPRIKKAENLDVQGDRLKTRTVFDMPFPLPNLTATTRVTHTVVPGESWTRAWTLDSGDYHRNEGSWRLTPFGDGPGRTLARYEVLVEPKVPIPKKLQATVQERALPGLVDAIRGEVRKRG
ncbi:MAG: SRPBCC family protein [Myxococcales bacterium]|nr:SRPBCC family protein [Myxococcales bacterium]MCB9731756.1 SRPBCC family protein [Deltaproteobacteria bacterium]